MFSIQASHAPPPNSAELIVHELANGALGEELARYKFHSPIHGEVLRFTRRLTIPALVTQVAVSLKVRAHPDGERIRQAWKLTDTVEAPPESSLKAGTLEVDMSGSLLDSALSLARGGGMRIRLDGSRDRGGALRDASRIKVHQAVGATFVTCPVLPFSDELPPASDEVRWRPGQPLPEPEPASIQPSTPRAGERALISAATKECRFCQRSIDAAYADRTGHCPYCLELI